MKKLTFMIVLLVLATILVIPMMFLCIDAAANAEDSLLYKMYQQLD